MQYFLIIVEICGGISAIFAVCLMLIKPFRKWALGMKLIEEGPLVAYIIPALYHIAFFLL